MPRRDLRARAAFAIDQVTQQFDERAERLLAHASSLQNACKQLKESVKLRRLLKLVLRVGNFFERCEPERRRGRIPPRRFGEAASGAVGRSVDDTTSVHWPPTARQVGRVAKGLEGAPATRVVCGEGSGGERASARALEPTPAV